MATRPMLSPDALLKLVAALVSATFGFVVLAAGPRRGPNRALAAFLLLLGANQGVELVRAIVGTGPGETALFRVATVFAALDPIALFVFARMLEGSPRPPRAPLAIVATVGGAFALTAPFLSPGASSLAPAFGLTLYTAGTYAACFLLAARAARAQANEPARIACFALAIAAVPVAARIGGAAVFALAGPATNRAEVTLAALVDLTFAAAIVVGFPIVARRDPEPALRRALLRASAVAAALVILLKLPDLLALRFGLGLGPAPGNAPVVLALGRGGASIRWLVFGAAVSMAVLRYRLLDMSLARRRLAARLLVGLVILLAGGLVLTLLHATVLPGPVNALEFAALALATALSQGIRGLIDAVAFRLYGVPPPRDQKRAYEAYAEAAGQALSHASPERAAQELERLRDELEIDASAAEALERAAESRASAPLAPGRVVARRYHIERELGRGVSGRAFLARDARLAREVVLKEILHASAEDRVLAKREAETLAGVRHPHVLAIYDVLERPGVSLLVTEYADGGSLADLGPVPAAQAARTMAGVFDGLAALHAAGVVHRDVKPRNILVAAGLPKLADFGLAARLEDTLPAGSRGLVFGTHGFMSPEQARGEPATPASDVYGAARVAHERFHVLWETPARALLERALDEAAERRPGAAEIATALRALG